MPPAAEPEESAPVLGDEADGDSDLPDASLEAREPEPASTADAGPAPALSADEEGRNLIVNYIPSSVSEDGLRAYFAPHGELESVKLVLDKVTRGSLGYGFVKFAHVDGATAAIQALNGLALEGKKLKVSRAKPRPPAPARELPTNLYISGLPFSYGKEELEQLLAAHGQVSEVRVLHDQVTKQSRGVGFGKLDTHDAATKAIHALNGITIPPSKLRLVVKFSEQQGDIKTNQKRQMAQQPYPHHAQQPYHQHQHAHAPAPHMPYGQPAPGYGPVHGGSAYPGRYDPMARPGSYDPYRNTSAYGAPAYPAQAPPPAPYGAPGYGGPAQGMVSVPGLSQPVPMPAPHHQHQHAAYGGQPAPHGYAAPPPSAAYGGGAGSGAAPPPGAGVGQYPGVCLFVYHLPPLTTEHSLYQLFSPYGQVLSAKVMKDLKTGENKGFGFVNMGSAPEASQAIAALNGYAYGGKNLKVSYKSAPNRQ